MNAVGIVIVWCVIQVSILASVAGMLYALARRTGPPTRALTVFAGLLLIVVLSALAFSPWPRWHSPADVAAVNRESSETSAVGSLTGETASAGRQLEGETEGNETVTTGMRAKKGLVLSSPAVAFFETLVSEMQRHPVDVEDESWGWPAYTAIGLLIIAGIGVVRLLAGLAVVRSYRLRARRIVDAPMSEMADVLLAKLQAPCEIALCESELLTTPATIGWRRPLVILPSDWKSWTEDECRAVLAHEIAHIARNDFATLVAAQVAVVLHFYHPLVHWLAARLRLEQELAADAAAARLAGGQRTYLTTLAGMALRQSDRPAAWPARTFLPTRGTFMRRIEMLRDETSLTRKMSPGVRIVMLATLLTAGLAVAGLRGTGAHGQVAADEPALAAKQAPGTARTRLVEAGKTSSSETTTTSETSGSSSSGSVSSDGKSGSSSTTVEPFSLAYVPRDAIAVAALRPAELLNRPALAAVKKALSQQRDLKQSLGVAPERIEQVLGAFVMELAPNGVGPQPVPLGVIVRMIEAKDADAMIKALQPNPEEQEYGDRTYVRGKETGPVCLRADERTLVICPREDGMRRMIVAGKTGASKAKWVDSWEGAASADAVVLVNVAPFGEMLNSVNDQPLNPALATKLGAFAPLWQGTSTGVLSAHLAGSLKLGLRLRAKSDQDAKKVKATLEAAITLGQNSLSQTRSMISRQPGNEGAFFLGLIDTIDTLIDSIKFEPPGSPMGGSTDVVASAVMDVDDAPRIFAMLLPAIAKARQAARRTQSTNNLKQLGLAMFNYSSANDGAFPPAVLYGPDGKTPYSWRVALLPYLDQAALYQQYNFNEPWDSPNNKKVLEKMPVLFRDPNDMTDSTFSSYYAITGPSTMFSGKEGVKIPQVTDGLSNTLMIVEARRDIPWTKPEDIPYAAELAAGDAPTRAVSRYAMTAPLPKLGGHYPDIFLAAFSDGAVRAISQKIDAVQLRGLITRDGGELIAEETLEGIPQRPQAGVPGK